MLKGVIDMCYGVQWIISEVIKIRAVLHTTWCHSLVYFVLRDENKLMNSQRVSQNQYETSAVSSCLLVLVLVVVCGLIVCILLHLRVLLCRF